MNKPLDPDRPAKRAVGVCYSTTIDDLVLGWASVLRASKPTRGNAIAEMALTLNAAGWQPGDAVILVRQAIKQKVGRADSTRPRPTHQSSLTDAR